MIELPPLGALDFELWQALLDIADRMPSDWTLVGGQMVLLHALEHGRAPQRLSEDLDVVVDARVRSPALSRMLSALRDLGFCEAEVSHDEVAHRFSRGRASVDVLAPEGLGGRTDLRTVGAARTVEIGGGSYALARSASVSVSVAGRVGEVPRPDLAGAILIKAVAATRDTGRGPERHLRDMAFLLSLVDDPIAMRQELGGPTARGFAGWPESPTRTTKRGPSWVTRRQPTGIPPGRSSPRPRRGPRDGPGRLLVSGRSNGLLTAMSFFELPPPFAPEPSHVQSA